MDFYDVDAFTTDLGLGYLHSQEMKLCLCGIGAIEMRGEEKVEGKKVRDILRGMIVDKEVTIRTYKDKQGKYGWYLTNIVLEDGLEVNNWFLENGHARTYMS